MKKKLLVLLSIIAVILCFCSCKKEEKKTYAGSVMVYTTFDENTIKTIKNDFESLYSGVVLDYFYGDIDAIVEKVNMSFMLEIPEADIILIDSEKALQDLKNNSYLSSYVSKEDNKIKDEYKSSKNGAYTAVVDGNNNQYYVAVVSNGLNVENAELFEDYILSKSTQEMLTPLGFKTVRDDIKE